MSHDELRDALSRVLADRGPTPAMRLLGPLPEVTGGWANTLIFTCTLVGSGADGATGTRAVLKLYPADADGTAHAIRERQALDHLHGSTCPVPGVICAEPGPGPLGRPFLLMEHVGDRSFWSAFRAASGDARAELLPSFVRPLVALHALDAAILDPAAEHDDRYRVVDVELAGVRRDCAATPRAGLAEVVGWLDERRDAVPCERPVVLHRDYHPWNVVVDPAGELSVLDWDWGIGDPRFDLAWTCTLLDRSAHHDLSRAVRQEYERQSLVPLKMMDVFEVLTTVRWLLNVLPALGPDSRLGQVKREDFRAFLRDPFRRAQELLLARTGIAVDLEA